MGLNRRHGVLIGLAALMALSGCTDPVEDIDRTNPNALEKSLFAGEWYFARTVIDVPYETDGTFVGDRQEYFFGEDFPALRVRWRIEEDRLMACRVDEQVLGANSEGRTPGDEEDPNKVEARLRSDLGAKFPCTHPVASFKIKGHFDIIRQYNASTGEQSNVIVENSSDRDWHQQKYFRIDWTDLGVDDLGYNLESASAAGWSGAIQSRYYVQAEDGDCRVQSGETIDYSNCEEGYLPPIIGEDAIMLTNRMTLVPNGHPGARIPSGSLWACWATGNFGYGNHCTLSEIGMRYSFSKVPERALTYRDQAAKYFGDDAEKMAALTRSKEAREATYEELYYPDEQFERFGLWRVIKSTYTPGRGETDFQQYLATRFNLWQKNYSCNGDACELLPLEQRELRPIVYYLNREFPQDLVPRAFSMAKEWNDAFNGIKPGVDLTTSCKIVCGDGKPGDQCSATDPDWRMEGTCAFELRENDGNQFLGDLRYNFVAYIEDAGPGQPCGVGGPANDPETGELVNGVSYIYGNQCFDYIETTVMDMVDILCAQHAREDDSPLPAACNGIDENQFLRGLHVLELMQAQGFKQPPRTPIRTLSKAGYEFASDEMAAKLGPLKLRMQELDHHRSALHVRRQRAEEAGLARLLVPDDMAMELSGGVTTDAAELTDDQLARFNPLDPLRSGQSKMMEHIDHLASRAVEPAEYIFNDSGLWEFAKRHIDLNRDEFRQVIREHAFRSVTLHELGHNMGLRHNFIATFDRANFFPEYWDIKQAAKDKFTADTGRAPPEFTPFFDEGDETEAEFLERYNAWDADRQIVREIEHSMGIRGYTYSSIMDYHGSLYSDWSGLGAYDKAAMRFTYAGLVDATDCRASGPGAPEQCAQAPRTLAKWYLGGELCQQDGDCPMAGSGQTCRRDERITGGLGVSVCSNWDDDQRVKGVFNPRHKFCSDDRVSDQPFCNRFDEGESSEDIVRNMIETYERMFVFNNFRRYRKSFNTNSYFNRILSRYFLTIGDQMQALLYKYFFEPGFRGNQGPGGFFDMFRATVIGFDFLGNVLAQPESGSYRWNENTQLFEQLDSELVENPNSEVVNVPLGLGKPLYSSYQEGYFGEVQRLDYVGTFYDKISALYVLTARDLGQSNLPNDERFYLSFHDFFPGAFNDLLGSFISGDFQKAGLVFDAETSVLSQRTFWDGNFFGDDDGFDPRDLDPEGRRLEPGASTFMNLYTLIYAMQFTPYYQDLSFTNATRIFEMGGQTGFSVEGLDPQDFVVCESPLTHRRFVAVRTEEVRSIAIESVERCNRLSQEYGALTEALETGDFPGGRTRSETESDQRQAQFRMENHEDRMSNLVHISDILGVGSL